MTYYKQMKTVKGYDFFECSSAFQKSIRRGLLEDALYWGIELHLSNYAGYAWKRMMIMSIEDVGLADPMVAVQVESLHSMWLKIYKKDDKKHQDRLPFLQAIVILTNSKKSRYIDWMLNVKFDEHFNDYNQKQVPDYALDIHTRRGKQMGKTIEDFFTEGSKLENQILIENEAELMNMCQERWSMPDFDDIYPKIDEWVSKNGGYGNPVQGKLL